MFDIKDIEYIDILNDIAKNSIFLETKDRILSIRPGSNKEYIKSEIKKSYNYLELYLEYKKLDLLDISNITYLLNKLDIGYIFSKIDFLKIFNLYKNSLSISNLFKESIININLIYKKNKSLNNIYSYLINYFDDNLNIKKDSTILLSNLYNEYDLVSNKIDKLLDDIILNNKSKLSELYKTIKYNKYCICVKKEYKNSFKGSIVEISNSKNSYYIEPFVIKDLKEELNIIENDILEEENNILKSLSIYINKYKDDLLDNIYIQQEFDYYQSLSCFYNSKVVLPDIIDTKYFSLNNIIHPLFRNMRPLYFNMYKLGYIITGSNTGGKSVLEKTILINQLLLQSGILPLVYEKSKFYIFSNIFMDIKDNQNIDENLSTFSSKIINLKRILDNNLDNSLIVIDEICSGTNPYEGSMLSVSIIEYLINNKASFIISTHYDEVKDFSFKNEFITIGSMEFNKDTLLPTYKLIDNLVGLSNCFLICKSLNLNQDIIDRAEEYYYMLDKKEKFERDFEKEYNNLIYEKNQVLLKEKELDDKILFYNNLISNFNKEKDNIYNRLQEKYISEIDDIKQECNNLLDEIKKYSYNKEFIELKTKLNNIKLDSKTTPNLDIININDSVYIKKFKCYGKVLNILKDKYLISFGRFQMKFLKDDIIKEKGYKEEKKIDISNKNYIESVISNKLDLRGYRYEDIKDELESFIDKAIIYNYNSISIIHGFGLGVVRKRVWELLKINKHVKSYRFGQMGEGLNGATIVYLK